MEIKLPDEGGGAAPALTPANSGSGTDLNSRLSGMNYDSFQTGGKDGYSISEFLTKMAHGEEVEYIFYFFTSYLSILSISG